MWGQAGVIPACLPLALSISWHFEPKGQVGRWFSKYYNIGLIKGDMVD